MSETTKPSGAGVLFLDPQHRILILLRSPGKLWANLWELPGGKVEPGETPLQAARREANEEVGLSLADGPVLEGEPFYRAEYGHLPAYTTFTYRVPRFTPILNSAYHCGFAWVTRMRALRMNLHDGLHRDLAEITDAFQEAKERQLCWTHGRNLKLGVYKGPTEPGAQPSCFGLRRKFDDTFIEEEFQPEGRLVGQPGRQVTVPWQMVEEALPVFLPPEIPLRGVLDREGLHLYNGALHDWLLAQEAAFPPD